ncbi:peptidyl-prolyl cis-trans isomerase [Sphingorhabdus sp.]|uniref:peptidylprolyl isomerase n=1 Tax=Sphingorhabdus sp. TaxID=1902408 RepID=UPI003919EF6A
MMRDWVQQALREPLVHFLAAGSALFLLMGQFSAEDSLDRTITIDEAQVARLASQWEQTWRRPPSAEELDNLVRDYIKEEVYFREAMRLGLDADDPIIRRRLRAKMEFLSTAEIQNMEPTDAALERYFETNKIRYAQRPAFSFDQQFLGDDQDIATKAIVALNAGKPVQAEPLSVSASMDKASSDSISREFGDAFADSLRALPQGRWSGPVQSGFGWHAVRVREVVASGTPPLADIRQRVSNDWQVKTQATREAAAYQALLDGYDIRIAKP